jgi:uncharacterized membrane protein YqjE
MLKLFNSFQITAAFVAWPFLVAWLNDATFRGASVAFWAAIVVYVLAFFAMIWCVYNSIDKDWNL